MNITVIKKRIGDNYAIRCRDGKYRSHFTFGTRPSCVKEYRRESAAIANADIDDAETLTFDPEKYELRAYGVLVKKTTAGS